MNKIKIALLDSGIADELASSVDIIGKKQFYYDYYEEKIISNEKVTDYNGHGTSCVDTIIRVFPDVQFYIVKILGISGITDRNVFSEALAFAGELDADIILICSSFIDERHDERIRKLCKKISSQGKIIIASVQNGTETSPPADCEGVIGVINGSMDDSEFYFDETKKIQMQCSGNEKTVRCCNGIISVFQGNSRATALAAAHIAKIISDPSNSGLSINEALKKYAVSAKFKETEFENEYDCIEPIPFDGKKEKYYIENDEDYHRLIYILCEFFFTEDTSEIRTAYLPDLRGRNLLRYISAFIKLINERFDLDLESISVEDLQWAYLFYEKYIRRKQ